MATVTELVDLILADTGLTSGERAAALARLNHANREIVGKMGGLSDEATFIPTANASLLAVTDAATVAKLSRFHALDYIQTTENGEYGEDLPQLTLEQVKAAYDDNSAGPMKAYAFEYPNVYYDRPADGVQTVRLGLRLAPLTLVESAPSAGVSESTPTSITVAWHERLLASLACVLLLERYEGRETDAAYHRTIYKEAMPEFLQSLTRMGGRKLPGDNYATEMFDL